MRVCTACRIKNRAATVRKAIRRFRAKNNLAEQSIRHSVLNQRLTQGSRSAWQFLQEAVSAHYFHTPMPSLIPQTR